MATINGTVSKKNPTDFHQLCASCKRMFYFSHDCNGQTVKCPHCGHTH